MAHALEHLFAKDPPWMWGSSDRPHTTKQVAQVCPICEGRCEMPGDFYGGDPAGPAECRSCWGRGVIFVQESVG